MFKTTDTGALKQDKKCQPCWYIILSTMSGNTTITKSEGTCAVIGSYQHPRGIADCQFKVGNTLKTYKQRTAHVKNINLKDNHKGKNYFTISSVDIVGWMESTIVLIILTMLLLLIIQLKSRQLLYLKQMYLKNNR